VKCSIWNCRKKAVAKSIIGPVCTKHYGNPGMVSLVVRHDTQDMVEAMINLEENTRGEE